MNPCRNVTVTGARSQLGVFLLPRLLMDGHRVSAVSREVADAPVAVTEDLEWVSPGMIEGDRPACLVSCGPIELAFELVSSGRVVDKAVVFSTSSIRTKAASADRAERTKVERIAGDEERLKELCERKGIALALIRPTLVYGCGLDANVSLLLRLGEKTGLIPVSGRAEGLRQPVHAGDLAELATRILRTDFGGFYAGEAAGGSTLSYRAMAKQVAPCGSRRIRVLGLPKGLFAGLVRVAGLFGPWPDINPEMVHRQSRDLVFDDSAFRRRFGWNPRPFEPTASDFHIPPELQKYRYPPVGAT